MNAYWRAANYLSVGQIYLLKNPLLKTPLKAEEVKPRLLGHWGTTPGLNFIYVHLNRAIKQRDLDMLYIAGPGHGGPALVANVWLEGTYSEYYPDVTFDERGMQKLFKQFSFPGGIPSHVAPETPGSIHEGGELGYAVSHAYGAAFDNPNLVVACVVGDGEAETGPLAAAWHSNKFLNPKTDGAVLPILHLNGYKIANPTVLARISSRELEYMMIGYGYQPFFVEGSDPVEMHRKFAATLDRCLDIIREIQRKAREENNVSRPLWPMIIFRSPKGWTGPKEVDGKKTEDYWRSHQVPFSEVREVPSHLTLLEQWMRSYRPEELFGPDGSLIPELRALAPSGRKRMGDSPYANGGLVRDLILPDFKDYAFKVSSPGGLTAESPRAIARFLRDALKLNAATQNFRIFGPDETNSNRLNDVFEYTNRVWMADTIPEDDHLDTSGRVMEILSEHTCQGWLEGYLLTGRHGFFSCYEAFIHLIDSMFNQHAKWLKVTRSHIAWRRPIASLNYFLTSHVWRQDHNGFSHQDPGFIDHVVNKKAEIIRVYLPPDGNTLLSVVDHCLRSHNLVNVVVAGKQPEYQWLDMDAAVKHCNKGLGVWQWASSDVESGEPDVVMACAGDVPTLEALAATDILRSSIPDIKIRFVNVVDLMALQSPSEHPHGLRDADFDTIFTVDKPVIFAYHGYPSLVHRLVYRRKIHPNFHVRGYKEEGTTTTPFDMVVINGLDRYHLVQDVIERVPRLQQRCAYVKQAMQDKLIEHKSYIECVGDDMPEVKNWRWPTEKYT
jgi:xylulose-5-phosphate/fructose-6-phosphate phosphoketolase